MKLSKREKMLLLILIALIILFGYYKLIFLKQRERVKVLSEENSKYEVQVKAIKGEVNLISNKEMEVKVLNSKIKEKSQRLYPMLSQEKIIIEIDELLSKYNLQSNLSFSDISMQTVEEPKAVEDKKGFNPLQQLVDRYNKLIGVINSEEENNKTNNTTSSKENKGTSSAEQLKISLSFKGTYNNTLAFIRELELRDKRIFITGFNISQSDGKDISGSMVVELYSIAKLTEEDGEYNKWKFNNNYGKSNPFEGGSAGNSAANTNANTNANTIEQSNSPQRDNFDFVMSVGPISSDLPSIMLGRAKDSTKNTYVYADNSKEEPVEIYFTEKQGKYYYKYKTSKSSYPLQFQGEGVEFVPTSNTIGIKIFSSKRLSSEDTSGANIKVTNNTNKNLYIIVEDDDPKANRVNIIAEGPNIQVKRN